MPIIAPGPDLLPMDHLTVELALTTTPDDPSPVWTDITQWVDLSAGIGITSGRPDEYGAVQTGSCSAALDNTDGRFTAGNTAGAYYPNVQVRKKLRISYAHPDGGPVSYRFTGYLDSPATNWPTGGDTYSAAHVTAVDRFKRLGKIDPLRSLIQQEYLADLPAAYFTLGEPTDATTAGDTSKNGGATLATAQVGSGGLLTIGANTGPSTDAMPAPAFTPTNVTNGKYLSGALSPVGGTSGMTVEAFVLTSSAVQQTVARLADAGGGWVEISTTAAGKVAATNSGADFALTSAASFNDGATHLVALTQSIAGAVITATLLVDGVSVGSSTYAGTSVPAYSLISIGANTAGAAFTGTIAHVAAYNSALSSARLLVHYGAGSTGFAGERSDQRIARLARYAGIPTAEQDLEVGLSTSIAFVDSTGKTPLQAMTDVADTEGGVLFMDGEGLLRFHARSHRYNVTSSLTLDAAAVDESLQFVSNDSLLVNDVTASRDGGITFRAVNAASVTDFGTAAIALTLLTTSDLEVMDAANWKANQTSSITPRLPNLTLDLLTNPDLVAAAMLLELGSRITLSGLPAQAPAAAVDLFVEGRAETISINGWALTLTTTPAPMSSVWVLDSSIYSQLDISTRLAY